jgi:hypothetical protein
MAGATFTIAQVFAWKVNRQLTRLTWRAGTPARLLQIRRMGARERSKARMLLFAKKRQTTQKFFLTACDPIDRDAMGIRRRPFYFQ